MDKENVSPVDFESVAAHSTKETPRGGNSSPETYVYLVPRNGDKIFLAKPFSPPQGRGTETCCHRDRMLFYGCNGTQRNLNKVLKIRRPGQPKQGIEDCGLRVAV